MPLEHVLYCPRCDLKTVWSNAEDASLTLACTGCGLRNASPLTPEEHQRALKRYERPRAAPPKTWRFV